MSNSNYAFDYPEQLDFWPKNVIQVDFQGRYAYELSPPLSNAERVIHDWFIASEKERKDRQQRKQAWKEFLYSIRCMVGQFRLRVYKNGDSIIVERIPYRGKALQEQMSLRNMRVAK